MSETKGRRTRKGWRDMTRPMSPALGMLFMLPIAVGMEGDSASTSVGFGAGIGSYAHITRGCEGNVLSKEEVPYQDLAVSIDHRVEKNFQLGVKGGWFGQDEVQGRDGTEPAVRAVYVNPNAAIELRRFGLGLGIVAADAPLHRLLLLDEGGWNDGEGILPSGHLRIGTHRGYFSLRLLEGMPLVSGGGLLTAGIGFEPVPAAAAWIGFSAPGPYDRGGFLTEAAIPVRRDLHLQIGARYGSTAGVSEFGFPFGLSYRSRRL
jgi:hypothetical protein